MRWEGREEVGRVEEESTTEDQACNFTKQNHTASLTCGKQLTTNHNFNNFYHQINTQDVTTLHSTVSSTVWPEPGPQWAFGGLKCGFRV